MNSIRFMLSVLHGQVKGKSFLWAVSIHQLIVIITMYARLAQLCVAGIIGHPKC